MWSRIAFRLSMAVVAVLSTGLGSVEESRAARRPLFTEITGEVRLWGCTAAPDEVLIQAVETDAFVPGVDRGREVKTRGRRSAILTATSDPHVLSFRVPRARAGGVYTLGIRTLSQTCRDMRWQGAPGGLVLAGDETPVAIEGYAIRSRLEVWGTGGGRREATWVGADDLDFTNAETAFRTFRWQTDLPGVTRGELQIATERFPSAGRDQGDCSNPPGLVHREALAFDPRGWVEAAPVDFNRLLTPGRIDGAGVSPAEHEQLLRGAPIYARVVPQTLVAGEVYAHRCDILEDGLPGWVVLANLGVIQPVAPPPEPPPVNPSYVLGPANHFRSPMVSTHPTVNERCYQVIKPHRMDPNWTPGDLSSWMSDPMGLQLLMKKKYKPGQWAQPTDYPFCLASGGGGGGGFLDSLVDDLGDLVTGAIDATAAMVNQLSKLWSQIKKAAISAAADALDEIPWVDCGEGSLCRNGVTAGVDAGLVAMGVPPSLPDFDALVNEGVDYLKAKVVEEVAAQTGIPPAIVQEVADNAQTIVTKTMAKMNEARGGSDPRANWYIPWDGLRPARLKVNLWRSALGPEPPPDMGMVPNNIWFLGLVSIPRSLPTLVIPPPEPLGIPVVFRPNMGGLPAPKPKTKTIWGKTYNLPLSQHEVTVHYREQFRWERLIKTPCASYRLLGGGVGSSGGVSLFMPQEEILWVHLKTVPWPDAVFNDPHYSECTP